MATFGVVKGDLIASMGELVHNGTATGGAAGTLIDTNSLNHEDDFFNDQWIYIYGGTGPGQERRITDFVQSTSTLSVSPNWGTTPTATSTYYIYRRRFNNAAYEAGFKQALRLVRQYFPLPLETTDQDVAYDLGDPTLAATYSITVPTGMVAIFRIMREDAGVDGLYTMPLPGPHENKNPSWRTSLSGTTYKIILDKDIADNVGWITQGRNLKIIGQQYQAEPTSDASTISINPGPVIELAALLLNARDIRQPELAYTFMNRLTAFFRNYGSGIWTGSLFLEQP